MRHLIEMGVAPDASNCIAFDIETVRGSDKLIPDSDIAHAWEYKVRKEEDYIKLKTDEERTAFLQNSYETKAALYAPFGRIACIVIGYTDAKGDVQVVSFNDHDEKTLITRFFSAMTKLQSKGKRLIVSFSGNGFDIPYIMIRAISHDIKLHPWFDVSGMKPWNLKWSLDLADTLKGTSFYGMSLANSALCLNLPSPKDEIDGSMVSDIFWRNEDRDKAINLIVAYCKKDVVTTLNILNKLLCNQLNS